MRLSRVILRWYRSVDFVEFELGRFTVLFGKNNAGKTNLLESIYGIFAPESMPGFFSEVEPARGLRGSEDSSGSSGAVFLRRMSRATLGEWHQQAVVRRVPGTAHFR